MSKETTRTTADERAPRMALVFRLAGESFALEVEHVHEILDPIAMTPVPNASPSAPALVNVRGAVAPLIDVRHRLGMKPADPGADMRLIVLDAPENGNAARVAILADAVDEVIEADLDHLDPIPELGACWPEAFVRGVTRRDNRLVVVLNPETLFRPAA